MQAGTAYKRKYGGRCFTRLQNLVKEQKKGGRYLPLWGQMLTSRGADTYRYGGRCLPLYEKKTLFYAALRAAEKLSTISTISTISQPAPALSGRG